MAIGTRDLMWAAAGTLLFAVSGCTNTSPNDQFKRISEAKKAQLMAFLESKGSKLSRYEVTVTEEPSAVKRSEASHIGVIEFKYPVTKPYGDAKMRSLNTAAAEYGFSPKENKWIYKGCILKLSGSLLQPKEGFLVSFSEVKEAFEK